MIPRVFHQIWVNRQNPTLPPAFQGYADKWRALHPEWQHRLWNLENLDFPLLRPELIPLCANYAQVADVLRLEVLYRYGGIYIDTDFEPLRAIDTILHDVSHFFCSEDGVHISSGIIGAPAESGLILRMLEGLPATLGVQPPNRETGPLYLTRNLLAEGFEGDVSFFPSRLFYPYGWQEPHRAHESFPEAVAVHRWAHSWAQPEPWSKRVRRRLGRVVLALMSG